MAALEQDRVIEPAKNIKKKKCNSKSARFQEKITITIFQVNTDLLPINLPAFQSAAQITKIRREIVLYQNFKNKNQVSYI